MWLYDLEATSYILVLCVIIILVVLVLLVFGSLPFSCKYILLLSYCTKGRGRRGQVADSTRSHVIGGRDEDSSGAVLPRYPGFPFANAVSPAAAASTTSSEGRQVTFVTLSPGQLPHHYEARVFKAPATIVDWGDEPPPTYESLFAPPKYRSNSIRRTDVNVKIPSGSGD